MYKPSFSENGRREISEKHFSFPHPMADSSAQVTVKGPALPALKISPLWKLGH